MILTTTAITDAVTGVMQTQVLVWAQSHPSCVVLGSGSSEHGAYVTYLPGLCRALKPFAQGQAHGKSPILGEGGGDTYGGDLNHHSLLPQPCRPGALLSAQIMC